MNHHELYDDTEDAEHTPEQRAAAASRSTWVSVAVNVVLTVLQITVGVLAKSQALVADGIHSLSDLVADFVVLFAGHHARKDADDDHPYGHQRFETAASLVLGGLLLAVGAGMLWSAVHKLESPEAVQPVHVVALYVAAAALVSKELLFRYMLAVAKRVKSGMLVANAWHARSDAASSLVVGLGIIGNLAGYPSLDPIAALVVGLMVCKMGWGFAWDALHDLMDRAVDEEEVNAIRQTLAATPGVHGVHDLRTRKMGDMIVVDAHLEVDGRLSVEAGHDISVAGPPAGDAAPPGAEPVDPCRPLHTPGTAHPLIRPGVAACASARGVGTLQNRGQCLHRHTTFIGACSMSDSPAYTPPKVWTWNQTNGGRFANINRPVSGATQEKPLPMGRHPMQLYSLATPNGVKVTVMLEELLALGHSGAEYDAWLIRINEGDQFGSGFVGVNPNSKIPALLDRSGVTPIRVFESGAILMHLAEKFGALLPTEPAARAECLSWLFWQMGSAPYLGRRLRSLLRLRPHQDRIRHRPLRDGDQAPARRAGQAAGESPLTSGATSTPSPTSRCGPGTARWPRACCTRRASSCRCRTTSMCSAGRTRSPSGPPSSAAAWSTAPGATPPASWPSGTRPATSTPERPTSWQSQTDCPPPGRPPAPIRCGAGSRRAPRRLRAGLTPVPGASVAGPCCVRAILRALTSRPLPCLPPVHAIAAHFQTGGWT